MSELKAIKEQLNRIETLLIPNNTIPDQISIKEICTLFDKSEVWFSCLRSKNSEIKTLGFKKGARVFFNSKEIINVLKKLGYEIKK
jgi:hypothetical protein